MKLIIAVAVLAALTLLLRLSVSWFGPSKPARSGVTEETAGLLHPCPETPNCYSTRLSVTPGSGESAGDNSTGESAVMQRLQKAIAAKNGQIEEHAGNYLHATFKSGILGFTDDFECLVTSDGAEQDAAAESIALHCRSASRIGHSDFGVNKKRVKAVLQTAGFKPPD